MKLIVHAPNVHLGGGKTLLLAAMQGVGASRECTLIADARMETVHVPSHVTVERFAPSLLGRLTAEWRLHSLATPDDDVLCMGNLPPLFPCRGRVSVFLQNRYLSENVSLSGFGFAARVRLRVERRWLRWRNRPGTRLVVQTASMREIARRGLGHHADVMPFVAVSSPTERWQGAEGRPRFLYPASGEPHKNHGVLLAAWTILADSGVDAELHLTVDRSSTLAEAVERARASGLAVVNHGQVDASTLAELYRSSTALIYPSRMESFGLPLVEARHLGLPVVAAELDYVRDVVTPDETFDPGSPTSIARAVRRLLGTPEQPAAPLTPSEFIARIVSRLPASTGSS